MGWIELASLSLGLLAVVSLVACDLRHMILPDALNALLAGAAIAFHLANDWLYVAPADALGGAVLGAGLLYGLRSIYLQRRGIEALGLGDVKFMIGAGLWVGVWGVPLLLALASLAALLTIGCLAGARLIPIADMSARRFPFGPALCLALVAVCLERVW